jgi:hypothetical protein
MNGMRGVVREGREKCVSKMFEVEVMNGSECQSIELTVTWM